MLRKLFGNSIMGSKFLHYFVIISSLTFLFTLGPRILVDELSVSHPNTALAQSSCGQQPCPSITEVPTPPPVCNEHPSDYPQCGGTCNGTTFPADHTVMVHKSVDSACNVSFQCEDQGVKPGECGNPTNTPTPTQQCTPNEVVSTTQHCQSGTTQMCTFNIQHRVDCSTFEGGPFACQNSTACGFQQSTPPSSACVDQLFDCSCNGTNFKCMHRHTGCDVSVETHNELSGAVACHPGATTIPTTSPVVCPTDVLVCPNGTILNRIVPSCNFPTCPLITTPAPATSVSSTANATAQQRQSQNQSQSQSLTNVNNNTNTSNSGGNTQTVNVSNAAIVWFTPLPTAISTATPTSVSVTSQCPPGTTFQSTQGSTIFCRSTVSTGVTVGQGGGVPPQVISSTPTEVRELPNTGLPVVGLGILGLAPLGLKLRKYTLKALVNPVDIWTDRELKK